MNVVIPTAEVPVALDVSAALLVLKKNVVLNVVVV